MCLFVRFPAGSGLALSSGVPGLLAFSKSWLHPFYRTFQKSYELVSRKIYE